MTVLHTSNKANGLLLINGLLVRCPFFKFNVSVYFLIPACPPKTFAYIQGEFNKMIHSQTKS